MNTEYRELTQETHEALKAYIHKYAQLPEIDESRAAAYAMMTWIYPEFDRLSYLLLVGESATGKTTCSRVIGHICYKPMFINGRRNAKSILVEMNLIRGTAIIEEFVFSEDDEALVKKVLGVGRDKSAMIMKTEPDNKSVVAYSVFGPKIITSRFRPEASIVSRSTVIKLKAQKTLRPGLTLLNHVQLEKEAEKLAPKIKEWVEMTVHNEHPHSFTAMLNWISGEEQ
jgi:hypothetical protein